MGGSRLRLAASVVLAAAVLPAVAPAATVPHTRRTPPAPVVAITASPSSGASRNAAVAFAAHRATSVRCSLDGARAVGCASPVRYTSLAVGRHTFTVTATSRSG